MENFVIVLFKNKRKKKIIKGYSTIKNASNKFNELVNNNDVPFEILFENGKECNYEISLLSKKSISHNSLFKTDKYGRNQRVFLDDNDDYEITKIKNYKVEEKIFDWQENKRINFNNLIKTYLSDTNLKIISTLHNKLIIQNEDKFYVFSLKNSSDSDRLLHTVENYFMDKNKKDVLFVRVTDTIHRKWLYDNLEKYGIPRSKLYRQSTTHSK